MPQAQSGRTFGRLATGAAMGLFAGLALPVARKAVMQGSTIGAGDWMNALITEHRAVEKSFEALLNSRHDEVAKREMLLTKIAYALTKHAIEEENVIYPALAENAHAEEARHLIEEHGAAKTLIYDLRRIPTRDLEWIGVARELWTALQTHMREEEEVVFPSFHAALSSEENARLTRMMSWEGFKVA
jgi:iron-sulfur cluster repair protein YtfE (RIC family)